LTVFYIIFYILAYIQQNGDISLEKKSGRPGLTQKRIKKKANFLIYHNSYIFV